MRLAQLPCGFGVAIEEADLSVDLDAESEALLRRAFDEDLLLVAPGQDLTGEDHDRIVKHLGSLYTFHHGSSFEYLSNIQQDNPNQSGTGRLLFHNDGAYRTDVAAGTSLYAIQVSPTSPPTSFANSVRAYESLPARLKEQIAELHTYNLVDELDASREYVRVRLADIPAGADMSKYKHAVHPVVVTVPHTDRRALFVNQFNTSHIVEYGPDSEEGEELIQTLFGYLYDERNTYDHHYRDGDLVIWNNLGLQHARSGAIDSAPRHLRRVVLTSLAW